MSDTVDVAARVEPAPAGRPSRGLPRRVGEAFLRRREASVLVVAVALGVYFASASSAFLTNDNLVNIAQATAPVAIIAAGMVLVLVNGEIDLSVAVVFALAPFNMHYLVDYHGVPILLAIVLALAISALIGFINGFITVVFRVPSFVTTLGTANIVIGIVLTTSHAYPAPIPEAATEAIRQVFGDVGLGRPHLVPADRGRSSTCCSPAPAGGCTRSPSAATCSAPPRRASGSAGSRSATS